MDGPVGDRETDRFMTYVTKLKPHEVSIWKAKRPLLGQLDIELTERCNNNCIHCCINLPEDDVAARNLEMDTDFVKDVITLRLPILDA
jgi:MoaA/NifB/PqqE/SkfB family radical SAM enzyme